MHLTDWYDDCRRLAALVHRLGICLLSAGMAGWAEPAAAQDGEAAELCRNGVVVPDPQDHPGLVADCGALLGARNRWAETVVSWQIDKTPTWSVETPITQWEGISVSDTGVTELSLVDRRLRGEIPAELGQLTQLERLDLRNNYQTVIPPEIGQLKKLEILLLSRNRFEAIPLELSQLTDLRRLELGSNKLNGPIPPGLANLTQLERLGLGWNCLSGAILPELGQLARLQRLDLAGNLLTGGLPPELGRLHSLQRLELQDNDLTGAIPAEWGQLAEVEWLDLKDNDLSGVLPAEMGRLASLERLYLSNNDLTGELPPEWGQLSELMWLELEDNDLSGVIPPELGQLAALLRLDLSRNGLEVIPSELGRMSSLRELYLGDNELRSPIPPGLGELAELRRLVLSENKLTGTIPAELGQLSELQWLYLSNNDLMGRIPPELGQLAALQELHLSGNALSGPIPPELGHLTELRNLNLSHNQLTGSVSSALGFLMELGALRNLDLSHNRLIGPIPPGYPPSRPKVNLSGNEMICLPDSLAGAFGGVPACGEPPHLVPTEGRIYWTDLPSGDVRRADLDGSNIKVILDGGVRSPEAVALDLAAGKMYWANWDGVAGKIQRSDLDGSSLETILTGLGHPGRIALDPDAGRIYYTTYFHYWNEVQFTGGSIQRARLDGSDVEILLEGHVYDHNFGPFADIALDLSAGKMYMTDGLTIERADLDGSDLGFCLDPHTSINGIALDVPRGKMYWSDAHGIHRADLDGSNREPLVTLSGQAKPRSLTLDLEGGTMYWMDSRRVIHRADLDGSDPKPFFTEAEDLGGLAFDMPGNKIYWTETEAETIQRADLDGRNVEALFTRIPRTPVGLALDLAGNRIYWTDWATNMIHRADLDGANVEALAGGLTAPVGIALDAPRGRMYWTYRDTSVIQRADLDGANTEDLFTVEDLLMAPDHPDEHPRLRPRSIGPGMGGLALDLAAGRMYWTVWRRARDGPSRDYCFGMTYSIRRALLDGAGVEILRRNTVDAIREYYSPRVTDGIALDPVGGKMYWAARHFVEHDTWTEASNTTRGPMNSKYSVPSFTAPTWTVPASRVSTSRWEAQMSSLWIPLEASCTGRVGVRSIAPAWTATTRRHWSRDWAG